jgi:hypothetical protein
MPRRRVRHRGQHCGLTISHEALHWERVNAPRRRVRHRNQHWLDNLARILTFGEGEVTHGGDDILSAQTVYESILIDKPRTI